MTVCRAGQQPYDNLCIYFSYMDIVYYYYWTPPPKDIAICSRCRRLKVVIFYSPLFLQVPPLIRRAILGVLLPGASSASAALVGDPFAAIAPCPQHLLGHLLGRQPGIDNDRFLAHVHLEEAVTILPWLVAIRISSTATILVIPSRQLVDILFAGPVQVTHQLLTTLGMRFLVPNTSPVCIGSEKWGFQFIYSSGIWNKKDIIVYPGMAELPKVWSYLDLVCFAWSYRDPSWPFLRCQSWIYTFYLSWLWIMD